MDDNKGQRITLDELIDEVRISFRANVSLEAWEKIKPILASDSIHIWEDTTSLNKELQQLRAERAGLESQLKWRPITEYPPEMQPVICRNEFGAVGIGYVYRLDAEYPQWNFMAHGMNQTGSLNKKAEWLSFPLLDKSKLTDSAQSGERE